MELVRKVMRCLGSEKCYTKFRDRRGWNLDDKLGEKAGWTFERPTNEQAVEFMAGGLSPTMYYSIWDGRVDIGHSMIVISDASQMLLTPFNRLAFAKRRVACHLESGEIGAAFNLLRLTLVNRVYVNFMQGILVGALPLNLKGTLLGIAAHIEFENNHTSANLVQHVYPLLVAVFTSVAVMLFRMYKLNEVLTWAFDAIPKLNRKIQEKGRSERVCGLYCLTICLVLLGMLDSAAVWYAVVKVIAAFKCEGSMWNLSGCVRFPEKHDSGDAGLDAQLKALYGGPLILC